MKLQEQKKLINEFLDFQINGDTPYFNFYIGEDRVYSTDNLIDFLKALDRVEFNKITVTPF